MCGLPVDLAGPKRDPRHSLAFLGPLADELESWGIGRWAPLGEKVLDCPINWKLAIDTFAENYHFATVHKNTFATIARSKLHGVRFVRARTTDSSFPSTGFSISRTFRRSSGIRAEHGGHLRAVFPNIVLSCTIANWGVVPRLSPPTAPGPRSITVHQKLDTAGSVRRVEPPQARRRSLTTRTAPSATRTTALVAGLQANLESGVRENLVFGRNEPAVCSTATKRGRGRLGSEFPVQPVIQTSSPQKSLSIHHTSRPSAADV